jgi:TatD DNase family protein
MYDASMFDSHAHLQDRRIVDPASAWHDAQRVGVTEILLAGVDRDDWQRQELLRARLGESLRAGPPARDAGQKPASLGLYMSFGLHPQRVAEMWRQAPELAEQQVRHELEHLERAFATRAAQSALVALGETGLDNLLENRASLALQTEAFKAQLQLAVRFNVPLILHILRAHEPALRILTKAALPSAGGVVHSWSGSPELVSRYVELGLSISFCGSVTWHDGSRIARSAQVCPEHALLVETDAPDQTPRSQKPSQNVPAYLPEIIAEVARLRNQTLDAIAALTQANARRLFRIASPPA